MSTIKKLKSGELVKVTESKNTVTIFTALDKVALSENTAKKFSINEQLAALMEQVEIICKSLEIDLVPRFQEQLELRSKILNSHKLAKDVRNKEFKE